VDEPLAVRLRVACKLVARGELEPHAALLAVVAPASPRLEQAREPTPAEAQARAQALRAAGLTLPQVAEELELSLARAKELVYGSARDRRRAS
jgi:hypothetical protein